MTSVHYNAAKAEQQLRHRLFKIAVKDGYCTIHSSHDMIMEAMQRVVDEMNLTNIHPKEDIDYVKA